MLALSKNIIMHFGQANFPSSKLNIEYKRHSSEIRKTFAQKPNQIKMVFTSEIQNNRSVKSSFYH